MKLPEKENNFKVNFFFTSILTICFYSLHCICEMHLSSVFQTEFHSLHYNAFSCDIRALCEHVPFVFVRNLTCILCRKGGHGLSPDTWNF
jgi:hypothetical protein